MYDIAANKLYVKCGTSKMYLVDTKNICLCDKSYVISHVCKNDEQAGKFYIFI